jgi:hypothetical protein
MEELKTVKMEQSEVLLWMFVVFTTMSLILGFIFIVVIPWAIRVIK